MNFSCTLPRLILLWIWFLVLWNDRKLKNLEDLIWIVSYRFLENKDDIAKLQKCFAGLWSLDDSDIVKKAIERPELFVMKPQREGGGLLSLKFIWIFPLPWLLLVVSVYTNKESYIQGTIYMGTIWRKTFEGCRGNELQKMLLTSLCNVFFQLFPQCFWCAMAFVIKIMQYQN